VKWILLFNQRSKLLWPLLLLLGVVNSLLLSFLLVFISHIINQRFIPALKGYDAVFFFGAITVSYYLNKLFNHHMIRLSNDTLFAFEIDVVNKICFSRYEAFEKIGPERIHTAIADARTLSQMPPVLIGAINALVIVACGLGYLFYHSILGGCIVVALMGGLLLYYLQRNIKITRDLNALRDLQDYYYIYLLDLLHGFKEIKVSVDRNINIFKKFIEPNRAASKDLTQRTSLAYMENELIGGFSWYVIIGAITFGFPLLLHFRTEHVVSYVVVILYLMGPVAVLITTLPSYTNLRIALKRLDDLNRVIANSLTKEQEVRSKPALLPDFQSIDFKNVVYRYAFRGDQHQVFELGPFNLTIQRGELIFVTGGNGSGKTTLVMLLTGLYAPTEGTIKVNNSLNVHEHDLLGSYQSVIFSSNYLFEFNYSGLEINGENPVLTRYLEMMKLNGIARINEERNIIETQLSKGQQKRLAMTYALMEGKDILVLDEWAAEQDPEYRAFFYYHIIPVLINMGKTIVAVTHDDQYFHLASRIIKVDNGKILADDGLSAIGKSNVTEYNNH
jgi:cyclic peptide transporter